MKKLLFVLAIGAFVACNDSATETESTADTSALEAPATVDTATTVPLDTATSAPVDTATVR